MMMFIILVIPNYVEHFRRSWTKKLLFFFTNISQNSKVKMKNINFDMNSHFNSTVRL